MTRTRSTSSKPRSTAAAPQRAATSADSGAHLGEPATDEVNYVKLCGRLAAPAEERTLQSGDVVVTFRLVVPRRAARRRGPGKPKATAVDAIECSAWSAAVRRKVLRWGSGDVIVVEGALRRRFWHAEGGARSRYDVEVSQASRRRRSL